MLRIAAVALLLASACFAHAPEKVAGPEERIGRGPFPSEEVLVHEDAWGIPHIQAANLADAMYALGIVHAEERLWQMDLNRRVGHGRLSELLGKRTLGADRYLRTLQMTHAARGALEQLSKEERKALDGYVAGVNQVIDTLPERPPEYKLLRADPAPWTALDSLVWMKVMSLSLSGSVRSELLREDLIAHVGPERVDWFLTGYPADGPRILPDPANRGQAPPLAPDSSAAEAPGTHDPLLESSDSAERTEAPASGADTEIGSGEFSAGRAQALALIGGNTRLASNNWVLAASHTKTEGALLANDPHLGVSMPSIWYLAEIDTPDYHAVGTTFPGAPGVIIGHNEDIAWGITTGALDPQDLFYEKIEDDRVARGDAWVPLETRVETIHVRGRKPVEMEVKVSPHGPIVSEFHEGLEQEVALRWISHDDDERTLSAFLRIGRAKDWDEFREALTDFGAPAHNFVFADQEGHIGWKVAGKVPIRSGRDGQTPARGWALEDDWQGYVPHGELPEAFDPAQGYIATANNMPVPDDWPRDLGYYSDSPYRARRILELLDKRSDWDVQSVSAMQMDVHSEQAEELLPFLRALSSDEPDLHEALALLAGWDGSLDADSSAAAIYEVWVFEVTEVIARHHLGDPLFARWRGARGSFLRGVFAEGGAAALCTQPGISSCEEAALLALKRALSRLRDELGAEVEQWTWGELHALRFHHQLAITSGLKKKLDATAPAPGDSFTVNVASFGSSGDFTQVWLPSYRQVIDPSDWKRSRWIYAPGQSGVHYRDHYKDLLDTYMAGESLPMLFGNEARSAAVRVRTFSPKPN
jgi:penicillin amidase